MRRILDTPPSLLQSLDDSYALCAGFRYHNGKKPAAYREAYPDQELPGDRSPVGAL